MLMADALQVVEKAWPGQGVQIIREEMGTVRVEAKDKTVLGRGESVQAALQMAVQPILKAEEQRLLAERKQKEQDFKDLISFLLEKHGPEFREWQRARAQAGVPPGNEGRNADGAKQLVQIVPG